MNATERKEEHDNILAVLEEFGARLAEQGCSFYLYAGRGTVGAEHHGNCQPPTSPADKVVEVLNLAVLEICQDRVEVNYPDVTVTD